MRLPKEIGLVAEWQVVMGLTYRGRAADGSWQDKETVMSASQVHVDAQRAVCDRAFWLPFAGVGNGLIADAWAPIAELPKDLALACLRACAEVDVAAFAAPRGGQRPRRRPPPYLIWVETRRFASGAEAIRRVLSAVETTAADRTASP
jgi:hypothetical protein